MSFYIEPSDEEYRAKRKEYRELMKDFNVTKKYFQSIQAYVYCEICNEILENIKIDKQLIRGKLKTGLYIHKFIHNNPNYDPDDPEDLSDREHTVLIYIDSKYNVRGVRTFFGSEISSEELDRGAQIPIVVKEVPHQSVELGIISNKEFTILQTCDGVNILEDVADIANVSIEEMEKIIKSLRKKGLINIITKA